ncbi:MAG: response regulator transcription factor [Archangium sp.]|nr:response regulator transcription factor [Archangium sp.]
MGEITVVLADDHRILREGVKALLGLSRDLSVVGEASDGQMAVELCVRLKPDVAVMDIAMPGLGGLEATLEIKKHSPRTRILVLTQYEDPEYVRRFLKAGVSGFVLKRTAGSSLVDAIRSVHGGGLVLDPEVAREAFSDAAAGATHDDPWETLTDREKEVFKLIAEGSSSKEVAQVLDVSVKTAMSHREHLMEKLQVHNRAELVRLAIRLGVMRADPHGP